jgi:plastocyanin
VRRGAGGRGRSRRAGLVAALALAALGTILAGSVGGAAAAEGECEWQPHKVRVVKHVKRHGRRVKLVRQRVRWSCVPVPAVAAPSAPVAAPPATPVPTPGPTPAPPGEEPGNPHWFGAQAYEYGFEPTGASFEVAAGLDTIELINRGEDAHDLHLERVDTHTTVLALGTTASGAHTRGSATLEAGEYRLYCSLDDHAMKGMERTLIVP